MDLDQPERTGAKMADATQISDNTKSGGKSGLLIGIIASLTLGAGGFFASYTGLISGNSTSHEASTHDSGVTHQAGSEVSFVPLEPLVISLGRAATNRHLRFSAQLEVVAEHEADVAHLAPRVLDVLNGFLRAVDSRDIENPSGLAKLRAQMLRRVQIVTGEGRVRDLLITEFVLN